MASLYLFIVNDKDNSLVSFGFTQQQTISTSPVTTNSETSVTSPSATTPSSTTPGSPKTIPVSRITTINNAISTQSSLIPAFQSSTQTVIPSTTSSTPINIIFVSTTL